MHSPQRIRVAILMLLGIFLPPCSFAQKNQLSLTVGGLWSSDQTVQSALACPSPLCNPSVSITTDTGVAFEGDFVRRFFNFRLASVDMDIPLVGAPGRDIHVSGSPSSSSVASLYFTPSGRIGLFPSKSISPFATVGGGLAYYSFQGGSTTAGALQFGGGLDFKTHLPHLGLKVQVRDFYAGSAKVTFPAPGRQHNVFAGGGVVLRF